MRHFRREQFHLNKKPLHKKAFYYALAIALVVVTATFLASDFTQFYPAHFFEAFQRISVAEILLYAGYTLLRIIIAYAISLVFSLAILFVIIKSNKLENFLLPIFDILQSVPVLAFFPLIIVAFAKLHLPEVAAQVVLIVAAFWAILFGAIGGYNQIPQDILDAAKIYNAKGLRFFFKVVLPAIFPALVTGSILSFGASWNVIIISEYINYGSIQIQLPGLGNLLSNSAGRDNDVFLASLLTLIGIIFILDRLVWHRLVVFSERFKFE